MLGTWFDYVLVWYAVVLVVVGFVVACLFLGCGLWCMGVV